MSVDNYFRVIRRDSTGNRFSEPEDTFTFCNRDPHTVSLAYAKALRHMATVDGVSVALYRPIPFHGEWAERPAEWREREQETEEIDGEIFKADNGHWKGVALIGQGPPRDTPPESPQGSLFDGEAN